MFKFNLFRQANRNPQHLGCIFAFLSMVILSAPGAAAWADGPSPGETQQIIVQPPGSAAADPTAFPPTARTPDATSGDTEPGAKPAAANPDTERLSLLPPIPGLITPTRTQLINVLDNLIPCPIGSGLFFIPCVNGQMLFNPTLPGTSGAKDSGAKDACLFLWSFPKGAHWHCPRDPVQPPSLDPVEHGKSSDNLVGVGVWHF